MVILRARVNTRAHWFFFIFEYFRLFVVPFRIGEYNINSSSLSHTDFRYTTTTINHNNLILTRMKINTTYIINLFYNLVVFQYSPWSVVHSNTTFVQGKVHLFTNQSTFYNHIAVASKLPEYSTFVPGHTFHIPTLIYIINVPRALNLIPAEGMNKCSNSWSRNR